MKDRRTSITQSLLDYAQDPLTTPEQARIALGAIQRLIQTIKPAAPAKASGWVK